MTQETRATIHNLPVEVFDMILGRLDTHTLLVLARVSRFLGQAVLWIAVPATTLDHINTHSKFIIVMLPPAVAAPMWAPKITTITYSVERGKENHFLNDMRCLSVILSRLARGSLKSLKVRIGFDSTEAMKRLQYSDKRDWPKVLSRLLDIVILTGCSQVEFSSGQIPGGEPRGFCHSGSRPGVFSRFRDDVISMIRQFNYKPPPPTTMGVRTPAFETSLFFTGCFLPHTTKDLQRTSRTIQSLTMSLPERHPRWAEFNQSLWVNLCLSLRLPHLSSLVLKSSADTVSMSRDCDALLDLLSHLPNLISLTLDFYIFTMYPSRKRHSILHKLESLEAQPRFFPWLIPLTVHAGKRSPFLPIPGGTKRRSSSMSVRVLTSREVTKEDLDDAILCLNAPFPPDSDSKSFSTPNISVTLEMNFTSRSWVQWVGAKVHWSATLSAPFQLQSWSNESRIMHLTLVMVGGVADPQSALPGDNFSQIRDWMRMFPKLEHLEIYGRPFTQSAVNDALCVAIVKGCPQLTLFKFNGNMIKPDHK
ncbi:hypothetical protein P691DRAFT_780979 [Macrolepiota fuliginosa MF-IS2]|uniref:F-box domain-containing protein n=1 Tax=Macrolepiota fuliginosa MF-IS2 TaxID=1400762 RepID=A0A9P5XFT5_9AGAR|nr:hypothetical protein P691DRAFT_780979 [Macrolepiota fuliginosa MF-IS2]